MKREKVLSALLILAVFYFSFMILDRFLSLIYGINMQPYEDNYPTGFAIWGHLINGSAAAIVLYSLFRLYDFGKAKGSKGLRFLAVAVIIFLLTVIPYSGDASYMIDDGLGGLVVFHVIFNALYVFFWGLLLFKLKTAIKQQMVILIVMIVAFLLIHYLLYAPSFPEFRWII
jgi:hypothetical protein